MIWLTDEERERNKREKPAREGRVRTVYDEITKNKKCVACKSTNVGVSPVSSDETSVRLYTKMTCRSCKCEWYPGRVDSES